MKSRHKVEERVRHSPGDDARERRLAWAPALAVAGIVGPITFAVVALAQSLLREDHSLVAHPISALAAGPG